jgi:thiamine biosynthesis lipoprotein
MSDGAEASDRFDYFGSSCSALVSGAGAEGSAQEAVALVRDMLEQWHARFSRFLSDSELSRLNADARAEVPVSPLMLRLAHAVRLAAVRTGGLVDATMVDQIEAAGYTGDLDEPLSLASALALAPPRRAAAPAAAARWRSIEIDRARGVLARAPGLRLDSGGLAKGLFADVLAVRLQTHASFAVNCGGDLAIGGAEGIERPVEVESPFDGSIVHGFSVRHGGVATSGIGRRSWLDREGRPAHHLLDPATGRPAFTGIVQVTALAPSALEAEILAKAAILSGPRNAARRLEHGGVIVLDDGSHEVIEQPATVSLSQLSAFAHPLQSGPKASLSRAAGARVRSGRARRPDARAGA